MSITVGFHHGALADDYETQANEQGLTFGEDADFVQKVGYGLTCLWMNDCMTDKEYDRILQKFQKKILVKYLKKKGE